MSTLLNSYYSIIIMTLDLKNKILFRVTLMENHTMIYIVNHGKSLLTHP